jgi:peptidyl-prolyl cis-trans isomerase A (cyclophilin A)
MKLLLTTVLSGAALLAQTPPPAKTAAAPKSGTATKTGAAPRMNPALLNPAGLNAPAPPLYRVKFATDKGDFVAEVHTDWAPLGAKRFYNLVKNRFFTGAPFFRIVPNFIVQFGLTGDPAVNKAWFSANIKDDPVKQHNTRGTLVFATAGPNTRTTQLFINLRDNTGSLDPQGFAPFGTITEGMEVVDALNKEYGEQPDQGAIQDQGKAYYDAKFPRLSKITSATIIFPEAAAPASKAAPAATKTGTPPAPPTKKQ